MRKNQLLGPALRYEDQLFDKEADTTPSATRKIILP